MLISYLLNKFINENFIKYMGIFYGEEKEERKEKENS
ncbi:hypothetical protein ES705_12212 [subsurface metagenome]